MQNTWPLIIRALLVLFILTNCKSRYSNCIESPDDGHTRPKHVGNFMLNKSKLVHLLVYLYWVYQAALKTFNSPKFDFEMKICKGYLRLWLCRLSLLVYLQKHSKEACGLIVQVIVCPNVQVCSSFRCTVIVVLATLPYPTYAGLVSSSHWVQQVTT